MRFTEARVKSNRKGRLALSSKGLHPQRGAYAPLSYFSVHQYSACVPEVARVIKNHQTSRIPLADQVEVHLRLGNRIFVTAEGIVDCIIALTQSHPANSNPRRTVAAGRNDLSHDWTRLYGAAILEAPRKAAPRS